MLRRLSDIQAAARVVGDLVRPWQAIFAFAIAAAAAIGFLANALGGTIVAWLLIAIVLLVVLNLVQAIAINRLAIAPHSPVDSSTASWLPTPDDLDSVGLTNALLSRTREVAETAAFAEVAEDATICLSRVVLWPEPCVVYDGVSEKADRVFGVRVVGDTAAILERRVPLDEPELARVGTEAGEPWHADPSWRQLVHVSWLRERGRSARHRTSVWLEAKAWPAGADGARLWRIWYQEQENGTPTHINGYMLTGGDTVVKLGVGGDDSATRGSAQAI